MDWEKLCDSGKNLEIFTASYFQTLDYYVDSNLKWLEDKEDGPGKVDLFELDIYGKQFHKNTVSTILGECKRGCRFDDLHLFSGVSQWVKADRNLLICISHQTADIAKAGKARGIDVITPEQMARLIEAGDMEQHFSFFYSANDVSNRLFEKETIVSLLGGSWRATHEKAAYQAIRRHLAVLIGEVWKTPDLAQRSRQIKTLIDDSRDFVRTIARILQIKPGNRSSEYYMQQNPLCQAAGYLMLKDRIAYIVCAAEYALDNALDNRIRMEPSDDPCFFQIAEELSRQIDLAASIPLFLQTLVYVFGGSISYIGNDFENVCSYAGVRPEQGKRIISCLKRLFQLSSPRIQWGFTEDLGILSLKYTPYPLKGLGILNRRQLGWSTEGFPFQNEWTNSLFLYNPSLRP